MSENKNDGGPAFPHIDYEITDPHPSKGMSLRDYFAAKAMQGIISNLSNQPAMGTYTIGSKDLDITPDGGTARDAYLAADAMLKERSK